MNYVDYAVITLLVLFFIKGYKTVFIGMIGWIVGLLVGIWLAGQNYLRAADWLGQWIDNQFVAAGVGFIGVFIVVMLAVTALFLIVNKIFHFIPVFGFFNKLLGGALGIIESIIILGILF